MSDFKANITVYIILYMRDALRALNILC